MAQVLSGRKFPSMVMGVSVKQAHKGGVIVPISSTGNRILVIVLTVHSTQEGYKLFFRKRFATFG